MIAQANIFLSQYIEKRDNDKNFQEFNQCWGGRQVNKANMEAATKEEATTGHKSLKMSIKGDAAGILLNAARKVKIDKWMYCLTLLFLAGTVSLEVIKIDNKSIILHMCSRSSKHIKYMKSFNSENKMRNIAL